MKRDSRNGERQGPSIDGPWVNAYLALYVKLVCCYYYFILMYFNGNKNSSNEYNGADKIYHDNNCD